MLTSTARCCLVGLVRQISLVGKTSVRQPTASCSGVRSVQIDRRNRLFSAESSTPSAGGTIVTHISATKGAQDRCGHKKEEEKTVKLDICGDIEEEDEDDVEEMLQDGPAGKEWGGPTRGGVLAEPTRFGDWERKGRCSDF